jgi:7,8-dihydropterin-6-yl-methyl-4-(beta-D-ribofuranosyl)aminobenzene 5'-phosphate synthase
MELTVLVDNNALTDRYFFAEPGVSYLIEDKSKQILFDVGYSNAFITNALKMNKNLLLNDFIVLSHGHLDHTWGLDPLLRMYTEAKIESLQHINPCFVAHPEVFKTRFAEGLNEIGCLITRSKLSRHFKIKLTKKPFWLTDRLVFLGEIERTYGFENRKPVGNIVTDNGSEPDFVPDDTALAYIGPGGLTVITGCAHSGICNTIEYARKICGQKIIADVIGGFHLMKPSREQMEGTLEYFKKLRPVEIHPCHCVDLESKIALSEAANVKEAGVGLSLRYD